MIRPRRILPLLALAVLVAGVPVPPAAAQEPYPSRPISVVVPFPPGGVADLTARPVAAAMEKALRQPVGVVNKTGAAGAVGMQFVATSKPDGYTLLLALSSISIIPEADKLPSRSSRARSSGSFSRRTRAASRTACARSAASSRSSIMSARSTASLMEAMARAAKVVSV
jgi:hypothetical protein